MADVLNSYLSNNGKNKVKTKLIQVGTKSTPATVKKKEVPNITKASEIFVPKKAVPVPTTGLASSVVVKQAVPAKVVQPAQSTQQVVVNKPTQPVVKKQTVAATPVIVATPAVVPNNPNTITDQQGLAKVAAEDVGEGLFVSNTDDKAIYDAFKAKQAEGRAAYRANAAKEMAKENFPLQTYL